MSTATEVKQLNSDELAVLSGIRAAVKERGPDYVYTLDEEFGFDPAYGSPAPCVYVKDGKPACIVGVAFSKVSPEAIAALERHPGTTVAIYGVRFDSPGTRPVSGVPELGKDFVLALQEAQDTQDDGGDWGYALEMFLTELQNRGYDIPEEEA